MSWQDAPAVDGAAQDPLAVPAAMPRPPGMPAAAGSPGWASAPPAWSDAPPVEAPPAAAPAPAAARPAAPEAPPAPSFGRGVGLGVRDAVNGLTGLGSMVADAATWPGRAAIRALGGEVTAPSDMVKGAADAVGLPEPVTARERYISGANEGAASVIPTMGAGLLASGGRAAAGAVKTYGSRLADMLLGGTGTQIAAGVGSGVAGEGARANGAGPLGQFAAAALGGVGGAGVASAGNMVGRGAAALAAPFTEGGREGIVARTLLQQASDPAGLRARLLADRLDPSRRLPDSPRSTAQASRDPGLAMIESGLRSDMSAPLGGMSPAATFAGMDAERNAARTGVLPAPVAEAAGLRGADVRGVLEPAQAARREQTNQAYGRVDPEGASRIAVGGVREASGDLAGIHYGHLSGGMPPGIASLADDLRTVDVLPYQSVQNLRSRAVMLQDQYPDGRAQSYLVGIKKALDDAAERASLPQERPSVGRSAADMAAEDAAEGASQRPDVDAALTEAQNRAAGRTNPAERIDGRAVNGDGSRENLASFIVRMGGVQDPGGDVLHIMGGQHSTRPGLINRNGLTMDKMRELATQEGYIGRFGADATGGNSTGFDDFLNALHDEIYTGSGSTTGRPPLSPTAQQVDAELAQRGLSLRDDRGDVLRGVRQHPGEAGEGSRAPAAADGEVVDGWRKMRDSEELTPGQEVATDAHGDQWVRADGEIGGTAPAGPVGPAPDGAATMPDGFTPDQARRWREAKESRRVQGRDFERDETGTAATGTILQRGSGGGFNVPDNQVTSHALGSPDAARQVLRAGGDEVRPALQQAFMDRAHAASAAPGIVDANNRQVLGAPGFLKFWEKNRDVAATVFGEDHMRNMDRLAADFSESASVQRMAQARGSDTARNLSVGNVLSMVSRGLIDPKNAAAQTLMRPFGFVMSAGEGGVRRLLLDAMADPATAERLLAKAPQEAVDMALGYAQRSGLERLGQAVGDAGGRTTLRAGGNSGGDPQQGKRDAMARRLRN